MHSQKKKRTLEDKIGTIGYNNTRGNDIEFNAQFVSYTEFNGTSYNGKEKSR
jgi:hypothetical protein